MSNENTTRFTIRDVPLEISNALDRIAIEKNYQSRNQLIVDILTQYVTTQDEAFVQSLPPIVRSMCKNELNFLQEQSLTCVNTMSLAVARLLRATQHIEQLLIDDENSKKEYEKIFKLLDS